MAEREDDTAAAMRSRLDRELVEAGLRDAPVERAGSDVGLEPTGVDGLPSLRVADDEGVVASHSLELVLGTRRREDFLTVMGSRHQVAPLSWMISSSTWTDPSIEMLDEESASHLMHFWSGAK